MCLLYILCDVVCLLIYSNNIIIRHPQEMNKIKIKHTSNNILNKIYIMQLFLMYTAMRYCELANLLQLYNYWPCVGDY